MHKKSISLLLCLCMLGVVFTGCKSGEVRNVESLIDDIGDVGPESGEALQAAQEAYDDLSREDQKNVSNADDLEDAWEDYVEVAGNLLDELAEALQSHDFDELNDITEQFNNVMSYMSEDYVSEVSDIDSLFYPDTNILNYLAIADMNHVTEAGEEANTMGTTHADDYAGIYSYIDLEALMEDSELYVEYLESVPGVSLVSEDHQSRNVFYREVYTFSYDGGHIDVIASYIYDYMSGAVTVEFYQ